MGKRGPLPEPGSRRARSHSKGKAETPNLVVLRTKTPRVPSIPKLEGVEWRPETRKAWRAYWKSDVAQASEEVDFPAVVRYFRLLNQFGRAMELAERAMVVRGSRGQVKVNPLASHALDLHGALQRSENELGLTPMARARLGLTVAEGRLTVEQINAMAQRRGALPEGSSTPEDAIEAEVVEADELLAEYEEAD